MTNWLAAIIIGLFIGLVAALLLGRQFASVRWLAPLLSLVGALIAAGIAGVLGYSGYGWKKAALQVVLALVGAGVAILLARRSRSVTGSSRPVAS